MKTGKFKKRILAVFTSVMILLSASTVMAAGNESDLMPELTGTSGTLKVTCKYDDNGVVTKIDGVELEVTQVADVSVNNGSVTYSLLSDYQSSGIDFEGMTASESSEAAQTLLKIKEDNGLQGSKAVTDADGIAGFSDLPYGMYLVSQSGSQGTATEYESIQPFLVMVPGVDSDTQTWIYDVETEPKLSLVKITPPETETETETETEPPEETTVVNNPPSDNTSVKGPKTGDTSNLSVWTGMLLISAAVIMVIAYRKKRNEKN